MTQTYQVEESIIKEEKPLIKNMRENFWFFFGSSLLYGIVFAFCLYKNMNGITFPIYVAVTIFVLILFIRRSGKRLRKNIWIYFVGMLLLGISTCMTTNIFFLFFNWAGILLLLALALLEQFFEEKQISFLKCIGRILNLLGNCFVSILLPFQHGISYAKTTEDGKKKNVFAVIAGVSISFGFLLIVFPLLLQSDRIFDIFVSDFFEEIQIGNIIGIGFTIIIGTIFIYSLFAGVCSMEESKGNVSKKSNANPLIGITFSLIVTLIYLFYCGIQIIYLFFRAGGGLPMNLTYSQYAHEGFWQLLFVSLINFAAVLFCLYIFKKNRILDILLTVFSGCTFIMIFSAAYRMILYVKVYHLTFLRVMVLWFLAVLTFIMAGVVLRIYQKKFVLFPYTVMVVSCAYIFLSLSRPDYQIARYNLNQENLNFNDVWYLMYECSDDVAPLIAEIDADKILSDEDSYWGKENLKNEIDLYLKNIEDKYEDISLREWNYAKYSALKAR